ncbi:MAG: DUF3486 family protein [Thermodesulfobacteriota bacterium]
MSTRRVQTRKKRQQSSIDRLPDDIREKLQELLRDPRVTDLEATARINAILDGTDHPERLSKSAVNRYHLRMEDVGARLRETREVAKMWIGRLGSEPQGETGKLLNELVRAIAFRAGLSAIETPDDQPIDPKLLKSLAVSVYRLERAANENAVLEEKIRKKTLEKAAAAVDEAAQAQGLDEKQARFWREKILGAA